MGQAILAKYPIPLFWTLSSHWWRFVARSGADLRRNEVVDSPAQNCADLTEQASMTPNSQSQTRPLDDSNSVQIFVNVYPSAGDAMNLLW